MTTIQKVHSRLSTSVLRKRRPSDSINKTYPKKVKLDTMTDDVPRRHTKTSSTNAMHLSVMATTTTIGQNNNDETLFNGGHPQRNGKAPNNNTSSEFWQKFSKNLVSLTREELERFVMTKIAEAVVYKSGAADMEAQLNAHKNVINGLQQKVKDLERNFRDLGYVHKNLMKDLNSSEKEIARPFTSMRSVGIQVALKSRWCGPHAKSVVVNANAVGNVVPDDALNINTGGNDQKEKDVISSSIIQTIASTSRRRPSISVRNDLMPSPTIDLTCDDATTEEQKENTAPIVPPATSIIPKKEKIIFSTSQSGMPSNVPVAKLVAALPKPNFDASSGVRQPRPHRPVIKRILRRDDHIDITFTLSNMDNNHAKIATYEIYSCLVSKATNFEWSVLGNVNSDILLPMTITLKIGDHANDRFYFAVCAIDEHGRNSLFSTPSTW